MHRPDSGQYLFEGQEVHVSNPAEVAQIKAVLRINLRAAIAAHAKAMP